MTSAMIREPVPRLPSASLVWVVAAASLLLVFTLGLAGRGALLRIAVAGGAALVGLALYFRRPVGYFHFTLWTWFLTPLVRRLVDWRVGFEDHNLVLLAPFLVSAIAGLTLMRERRANDTVRLFPFFLCMAGILYGFAVGLMRWRLHASASISPGLPLYSSVFIFTFAGICTMTTNAPFRRVLLGPLFCSALTVCINTSILRSGTRTGSST
jgi:hypothetical protein